MLQTSVTDEDEDLEQLRLAALKSLKKPLGTYSEKIPQQRPFYSGKNGLNRNRGSYHGRPHRNVSSLLLFVTQQSEVGYFVSLAGAIQP